MQNGFEVGKSRGEGSSEAVIATRQETMRSIIRAWTASSCRRESRPSCSQPYQETGDSGHPCSLPLGSDEIWGRNQWHLLSQAPFGLTPQPPSLSAWSGGAGTLPSACEFSAVSLPLLASALSCHRVFSRCYLIWPLFQRGDRSLEQEGSWPAHASVCSWVSRFHGYNTVIDTGTAVADWMIRCGSLSPPYLIGSLWAINKLLPFLVDKSESCSGRETCRNVDYFLITQMCSQGQSGAVGSLLIPQNRGPPHGLFPTMLPSYVIGKSCCRDISPSFS